MGFFPGNNFELGFIIGQSYEKSKSKTSGSEHEDTSFSIGPQLGGHIPLGNSINLFINGALGLYICEGEYKSGTSSIYDDKYDETGFFVSFKFGAEFFINDYVAWDVGIKTLYTQLDYDEEGKGYDHEYSETEFGPFTGIKVFLSR